MPYLNARGPPAHSATLPPIDDWFEARGIGRIEQPDLLDRALQIAVDDVRLDDREQVELVDLEDAIQPLHREHDAAATSAPRRPCSPCPRRGRRAARGAALQSRAIAAISLGVRWKNDEVGRVPCAERIGAVGVERRTSDADVLAPTMLTQTETIGD